QRLERAAVEQARLDVRELPLDLPLGLRPPRLAGPRFEAIVRGEGQELRVIQRAVGVVPQDHRLEVVVQAGSRHAAQRPEGVDLLTQRGDEAHRLDEAQVLPPRVGEQITEQVDAAPAFAAEVQIVHAVIHLRLLAWSGLEPHDRRRRGPWSQPPQALTHNGVLTAEAACPQLFEGALTGEVRVLRQQLPEQSFVLVQRAAPPPWRWQGAGRTLTLRLDLGQHAADSATRDAQFAGDAPHGRALLMTLHDLVTQGYVHGLLRSCSPSGPCTRSV